MGPGRARRRFLHLLAAGTAARAVAAADAPDVGSEIRGVAFDAFAILDPRPVAALAVRLFPDRGAELASLWSVRQFEYQWLRALSGRYADFRQTTQDALVYAAHALEVHLSAQARQRLVDVYLELDAWPDVPPALERLKTAGVKVAFLSNATPEILQAGIRNASLGGLFDHVLSTAAARTYKPHPSAYRLAVDAFTLDPRHIAFVAFAGWDAAGAKSFGYATFWVNRLGLPAEELGIAADATGASLEPLPQFVTSRSRRAAAH